MQQELPFLERECKKQQLDLGDGTEAFLKKQLIRHKFGKERPSDRPKYTNRTGTATQSYNYTELCTEETPEDVEQELRKQSIVFLQNQCKKHGLLLGSRTYNWLVKQLVDHKFDRNPNTTRRRQSDPESKTGRSVGRATGYQASSQGGSGYPGDDDDDDGRSDPDEPDDPDFRYESGEKVMTYEQLQVKYTQMDLNLLESACIMRKLDPGWEMKAEATRRQYLIQQLLKYKSEKETGTKPNYVGYDRPDELEDVE